MSKALFCIEPEIKAGEQSKKTYMKNHTDTKKRELDNFI
jgi:hypothetical protein